MYMWIYQSVLHYAIEVILQWLSHSREAENWVLSP